MLRSRAVECNTERIAKLQNESSVMSSVAVVGVLGMTHDPEMRVKYNYPLSLLKELIREFSPDVICGEVHPQSWDLYNRTGDPNGIFGETQAEYPNLIFPLCQSENIQFVPINWFEADVFEGPFDRFDGETRERLEQQLFEWNQRQLATWDRGSIPLNSFDYDAVTSEMYEWLHSVNPEVQDIVWTARHNIMIARVKNAIQAFPNKRILCTHGADHSYWYHRALARERSITLVYPLR